MSETCNTLPVGVFVISIVNGCTVCT